MAKVNPRKSNKESNVNTTAPTAETTKPADDKGAKAPATTEATAKDKASGKDKSHPDADAYGRLPFPGLKDAEGKEVKLEAVPKEYNSGVHRPLLKDNFKDESYYFVYKAELHEAKAADYRKQAEDFKKLGDSGDRKKAKRLLTMQKRMADLKAELEAQGVDVSALMGDDSSDES